MNSFDKPTMPATPETVAKNGFRLPSKSLIDKKRVQLGGQAPAFRMTAIADKGNVRLGGQSPIFRK